MLALPNVDAKALKPDFEVQFNEGGAAITEVRLTIAPNGVPFQCERGFLNGPHENADALCSMLKRVQFRPARDSAGNSAHGRVYVWSHWSNRRWTGFDSPSWSPGDLGLTVNKMPNGYPESSKFFLALDVDSDGAIKSCGVVTAQKAPLSHDVVNLLCREASAHPAAPATDENGNAVPSVQQFIVRLNSQKAVDRLQQMFRRDVSRSR
jgi:hypothetical protein